MIIYELIYYWDDTCDGTSLNDTVLLTDIDEVNNKIKEFQEQCCEDGPISSNSGSCLPPYKGRWIQYVYEDDSSSNLVVRIHNI